ncbi:MAG: hypothetical protein M1816_000701 [Peltula sp. TS41687]|nr:MAG: hypothetical protein M1816_000701 [Peltula sp. TS41687]
MDSILHHLNHVLVPRADDPNQGKARDTPSSLSSMISTLVPALLIALAFFLVFLILRRTQRRIYSPRSYLGTLREEERSPDLPKGLFNWLGAFFKIPDTYVLNHHSLDAYLFLRYLRIAVAICFFGCLIVWPVLFPINITGGRGLKELDMLSFGNVASKKRYYAHAIVSCVFFGFVLYMITRESLFYINLRQAYLLSPLYANRMSSRTVLFTSVPDAYLDEGKLRQVFGRMVKNVWICTDAKDIEDLVEERDKVAMRLEGAETKLVRLANAARLKAQKKGAAGRAEEASEMGRTADEAGDSESGSIASRWIPQKKRPTHRLKFLIGKKVDTINWCRSELGRLLPEVEKSQSFHRRGEAKRVNSVFVEFYSQSAAQDAVQTLAHHQPLHMAPRYIGIRPGEVIWKNLKIKWWERILRVIVTTAFVTAMIIFWAVPVTVVGAISNIDSLKKQLTWLSFLDRLPKKLTGVVTGLLPVVALSILMALVPIILRLMAKLGGAPSLSQVELTVQKSYFAFQVIQVFLVTTLASAAASTVSDIIDNPSSATDLLAQNLPRASNFYISYFILQGLTLSASALLQIVGLILYKVLSRVLNSTPRKVYKRWANLAGLGWGTLFPVFTLFPVIAITYSCIAPLVLGFATVGLYLLYLAYRYNLLFVFNANIDTKGVVYPQALRQTLVGVYLAEFCLIGLFSIKAAVGPIIIEVAALIFTVLYHIWLHIAIGPLLSYLPKTLAAEEESLMAVENGHGPASDYDEKDGINSRNGKASDKAMRVLSDGPNSPAPHKKPNFLVKWLRPDKYCDYNTLRRLVPRGYADLIHYSADKERDAYYHPAIASETPTLWIPKDEGGVSRQEVRQTSGVIPITDEGAHLDEKNKIVTNQEEKPPIHEETVYY